MSKAKTQEVNKQPTKTVNLVHKDLIHSDTIKKEMKYSDRNVMKQFQLNPHNVYILPEKPNYVDPHKKTVQVLSGKVQGTYTEDPVEEAFSNQKLEKVLRSTQLVPRQKFIAPMTATQEIGWFATQMGRPQSAKDHKLSSCEITNWASEFYALKKINPFKIR